MFRLSLLVSVCLALVPIKARAQSELPLYPELAGTVTIHADGVAGVKMRVPTEVKWFRDNIELETGSNVHSVFAAIRYRRSVPGLCDLCFLGTFVSATPTSPFPPQVGGCYDDPGNEKGCRLDAGVAEIYIVADGQVTLTMKFPELSGQIELEATGAVDGVVEEIPSRCLVPDCSVQGGGRAHEIGLDGRAAAAGVTAWVKAPGPLNPSEIRAIACAYPGFFNSGTGDPSEHPQGCDITSPLSDDAGNFWLLRPGLGGEGNGVSDGSGATHGSQYLGFNVRHRTTLAPSQWEARGWWLNEGITCPSNYFLNCV